ncbi:efflux RND transporter periplasmic adaptor subunit [Candidatus Kaiserbacteria bacterium]|nr:efflux RND transporter periplasmic adaptor subunit [Candidatus Kaiserbacteria bacterium]
MNTINKSYVVYGTLLIIIGVVGYLLFQGGAPKEDTLIVVPGDFLQQVSVSGKVVSSQSVDLAFSQTGRVSAVYADVGDIVNEGTVLASIENGDTRAEILQKEAALLAAQAVLSELKKGSRTEEIDISKAKVDSAKIDVFEAERSLKEKISDLYIKSDDAVRTQADQLFSNPKSPNPQLLFKTDGQLEQDLETRRVQLEQTLSTWSVVLVGDDNKLADISLERSTAIKSFLERIAFALSTLDTTSQFSQTTIDGWKTDISSARTNLSTATNNLVSASGTVATSRSALVLAEKELLLKEAGVTEETIKEQEAKIKSAQAEVVSAQARYQKTLVAAPFSGIVSKMDAKVGSSAASNTSLISMMSVDIFQIESFVPEINAFLIEVGDTAEITLDAYGPLVTFKASVISTDPAETIRDGVSTYRATLRFMENDNRIKSGMTANIILTTEEKHDVIAIPQGVVFNKDGKSFVYVREGGIPTQRFITTGSISSVGDIEILSGLKDGDVVLLTSPN